MNKESRVHKSLLNARVGFIYYFLFIILSFFSRKTFLECLGADFLGLAGTLSNILGFLSLAEMGVATAVAYNLYKPLEAGDKQEIENLVSVFGFLYRKIGLFILGAAIIISCFIPLIFKNTIFSYGIIYFAFYSILLSSLFSYFINYRQIILTADQKGYLVTVYLQGAMFVKILVQMAVAIYLHNYFIWIGLEVVYGIVSCLVLNWKIHRVYPWLNASVAKGKEYYHNYKHILNYTKQVFVHKIKDFILTQSDQILIFAFVSLKMVAFYGNYTLIVSRISAAFSSALNSFGAGVGNLIAEHNTEHSINVFWEIVSIRFIVAGLIVFSVYNFIEPFISLWLGSQYILDRTILVLLMTNIFIMQSRGAVDMFNNAHGLYADTWSAWVEGFLNVGITLATAPFLGITGILLGKIVSLFLIVVLWKPYYLFHDGFKVSVANYWKRILRYYVASIGMILLGTWIFNIIPINAGASFYFWGIKAVIVLIPFTILYITILTFADKGAKDLFNRIKMLYLKR